MEEYDKYNIFSKCENIVLEAKRVVLNEELNKIANITLSGISKSPENIQEAAIKCTESLNLKNNLPNPKIASVENNAYGKVESKQVPCNNCAAQNNDLLKKYFSIWIVAVQHQKNVLKTIECKNKLYTFIKKLKSYKKEEENKSLVDKSVMVAKTSPAVSFKHRFDAQKNTITMQKQKLNEQSRLIDELKLGIIRENLLKSIDDTKVDIRQIFGTCSERLKLKAPLHVDSHRDQFKINSQKAPQVAKKMEQRAIERAHNRQVILERKQLIESKRKQLLEHAIEEKRTLEEEEKKRNLQMIQERRMKELQLEKLRQAKKLKYLDSVNIAYKFYKKMLMNQCFRKLYNNYQICKVNHTLALVHYENNVKQIHFKAWFKILQCKLQVKCDKADSLYCCNIITRSFKRWHEVYFDRVKSMQVAEDLYDLRLTSNTFLTWHRQVCKIIVRRNRRNTVAKNHYNRRILLQYFYQWRSLPAVVQLEKAKEQKKRKWREKVWQVLPDYEAPEVDF